MHFSVSSNKQTERCLVNSGKVIIVIIMHGSMLDSQQNSACLTTC